jgi:hypothetical protein
MVEVFPLFCLFIIVYNNERNVTMQLNCHGMAEPLPVWQCGQNKNLKYSYSKLWDMY